MSKIIDDGIWLRRTTKKLRLAHASFADMQFDEKSAYLEDEIEYALTDVGAESGEKRDRLLKALADNFPVFGEIPTEFGSDASRVKTQKPKSNVDTVMDSWRDSSDAEQAEILTRLNLAKVSDIVKQPEISASNSNSNSQESHNLEEHLIFPQSEADMQDFKRVMDLLKSLTGIENSAINFTRLFKVSGMLFDSYTQLSKVMWEFWFLFAPKDVRNVISTESTDFKSFISSYINEDEGVGSGEMAAEIQKVKLIALSLCFAVRKSGEEFGRLYNEKMAPDNIETAVVIEDTAADVSKVKDLNEKSWAKYKQLAKHMTAESLDEEFQSLFGRVMAAWMANRK